MVTALMIKGAAPSLGLPGVAQSAETAVAQNGPPVQLLGHLKSLVTQCERELAARRAAG